MLTIAVIAFREFLEAFLLVGIFIGIDRKLGLKKRKEIILAAISGIVFSVILPILVFLLNSDVRNAFTEKSADTLEGFLLVFSGIFLVYIIFSLHASLKHYRDKTIANVHAKMEQELFDISLFFTIIFFIAREGFEIALLVTTISFFSSAWVNLSGLMIGFLVAACIGLSTVFAYVSLPIGKVFQCTQYVIICMGGAMVTNGTSMLLSIYFHMHLDRFFPLPFQFLPSEETIVGHLLKNLFGLQQKMGIIQLGILGAYIAIVYLFFAAKKHAIKS